MAGPPASPDRGGAQDRGNLRRCPALFSHAAIAPLVGLGSVNTLKKRYAEELALGGAKACVMIAEKLQKLVAAGNEEAILLLAKVKLGLS